MSSPMALSRITTLFLIITFLFINASTTEDYYYDDYNDDYNNHYNNNYNQPSHPHAPNGQMLDYYTLLNLTLTHLPLPKSTLLRYEHTLKLSGWEGKNEYTLKNVKREYRRMAKIHHPDKRREGRTGRKGKGGGKSGAAAKGVGGGEGEVTNKGNSKLRFTLRYLADSIKRLKASCYSNFVVPRWLGEGDNMFVAITNANDVLGDEDKRREYDAELTSYLTSLYPPLSGLPPSTNLSPGAIIQVNSNTALTMNEECEIVALKWNEGGEDWIIGRFWGGWEETWSNRFDYVKGKDYVSAKKGECIGRLDVHVVEGDNLIVILQVSIGGETIWEVKRKVKGRGEVVLTCELGTAVIRYRGYGGGLGDQGRRIWCGGGCWRKGLESFKVGRKFKALKGGVKGWWDESFGEGQGKGGKEEEGFFEGLGEWIDGLLDEADKIWNGFVEEWF